MSTGARALDSLDELPRIETAAAGALSTAPGELHLWYAFTDDARDPHLCAAYDALLTPDERARQDRFVFDKDRHLHRVTRALQRTVLSRYAAVAPRDWRFAAGEHGKPSIAAPLGAAHVRFNLTNTPGLVACAVSTSIDVLGIDAEEQRDNRDLRDLADRFFSPREAADARAVPAAIHAERFYSYWTLKEAYLKARGAGLTLPLDQFSLDLGGAAAPGAPGAAPPRPITVAFEPGLPDDAAAWRFALWRASPRHLAAVAARTPGPLAIRAARCVPLVGELA